MPSAHGSTAPAPVPSRKAGRARLGRRLFLGALGAFLLLGMLNLFGSKTGTVSADENGYSLRVTFPQTTRSSLPVRLQISVAHPGGFTAPVRIGMPIDYFNLFDFNSFYPTPESTLNEGSLVIMTFSPPAGDTLNVLLDADTQAGALTGRDATTAVLNGENRPVVEVRFRTRVMP